MAYKDINDNNDSAKQDKRMPVLMLIVTDILLTCACLGAFLLYHYVLPRHLTSENIVVANAETGEDNTFTLPGGGDEVNTDNSSSGEEAENLPTPAAAVKVTPTPTATVKVTPTPAAAETVTPTPTVTDAPDKRYEDANKGRDNEGNITNYGNSDTMDVYADKSLSDSFIKKNKTVTEVNSYSSDNIQFTTDKVEVGSGSDKITYYVSDVFVTNVKYLKTAFAKGEYGKNVRESTMEQATDNDAVLAINGDYYGNSEAGVVIRNGVLYRSKVYDADICVLFTDGTMKTYSPDEFNLDEIVAKGAWQAWIFGPQLLDGKGNILSKFNSTYYLSLAHPRTAIGYVEPGHYVFLVIDGRQDMYSRGATLDEMAQMMVDAGCMSAYNLDGGQSTEMVYKGEFVNSPYKGGRDVSDIIYLGEE